VKGENGVLADSHNILNRWKKYSPSLNVHRVSNVRKIEIHTAEHKIEILWFWTLSIILSLSKTLSRLFFKTHFRDWIQSPSSGKTYTVGPN
jgi:hypothetical protein